MVVLSLIKDIERFDKLSASLIVHKRAAANIREQLGIITTLFASHESPKSSDLASMALHQKIESTLTPVEEYSKLSPLQSYLYQGAVAGCLDGVHEALCTFAQECQITHVREDIESQRDIYDSDRKADGVNLKRTLREGLRDERFSSTVDKLSEREVGALQNAINLELAAAEQTSEMACLFRESLHLLSARNIPSSKPTRKQAVQDLTRKVVRINVKPFMYGATTNIYAGELYGNQVSVYTSNLGHQPSAKNIEDVEAHVRWASFDHPNILPLLGVIGDVNKHGAGLVAPFLSNSTVLSFLGKEPGADKLKMITEFASALAYLHCLQPPYIHTFLTSDALLVNDEKEVVLAGFASKAFDEDWKQVVLKGRWMSPESILAKSRVHFTVAGDVYSFAMTCLEIMTGEAPFAYAYAPKQIILDRIVNGERPRRPDRTLIHHGLDDRLWNLFCRCWAQDAEQRPSMAQVHQELLKMRELPALDVPDLTSVISLKSRNTDEVHACGAFGDVRLAVLNGYGPVAVKTVNVKGQVHPELRLTKRFLREALIWSKLNHPNVLPFLGTADIPGLSTCLVSPFMPNGNSIDYLSKNRDVAPLHIAKGVARGLNYLHCNTPPVIHGDLRGANVLISWTGEPLLCDFGLAVIVEDLTQLPISTAMEGQGNPRWMAPELLVGETMVSPPSDVYAMSMVILELITFDVPFAEFKNSARVVVEVHKGVIPERPTSEEDVRRGMSDDIWELCKSCWALAPDQRPNSTQILQTLERQNWSQFL